ncbi:MAG: hypothetical protein ACRD6I_20250 [Candidatus Acidiferrales bacterium]
MARASAEVAAANVRFPEASLESAKSGDLKVAATGQRAQHDHAKKRPGEEKKTGDQEHEHHGAASAAMSGGHHQHMEAHMRWSAPRAETLKDLARASDIVSTLRTSLVKYKDYKAAIADGYQPFLPNLDLPMYHFTNYRLAIVDAFRFDAAKPSSLLYRKHTTGYELIGMMYTAPRRFSEAQLDERVPLSIARWHQHVNICLPSGTAAERARADWTRFGFTGSIATEAACKEAGGRWHPVIFGWMVHVYPFEQTQEKIWTH